MDPKANKKEQLEVAAQIHKIWDDCNADGTLTLGQHEELAALAARLADLVIALDAWEKS